MLPLYVDAFVEGMSTQTDSAPSCRSAGSILAVSGGRGSSSEVSFQGSGDF